MPKYLLQCGNTPQLSVAEFQAIFPDHDQEIILNSFILTELNPKDLQKASSIMGGVVKILEIIDEISLDKNLNTPDDLESQITNYLKNQTAKKITFAVAEIGRDHLAKIQSTTIKKNLKKEDRQVRFIEVSRSGANSAEHKHNKDLIEIITIQSPTQLLLTRSVWTQDPDLWAHRDRSKPYADHKKGMLPPKLARIMINLASRGEQSLVIDPFCGSGTILLEAMTLGYQTIGYDQDKDAVSGSIANIEWYRSYLSNTSAQTQPLDAKVFLDEASRFQIPKTNKKIVIVSEPFLGKPKPKPEQVANIMKGLSKLYLGWFKNMSAQLPAQTKICVVLPFIEQQSKLIGPEYFIDKLAELGYSILSKPIVYARSEAVVKRGITLIEKV